MWVWRNFRTRDAQKNARLRLNAPTTHVWAGPVKNARLGWTREKRTSSPDPPKPHLRIPQECEALCEVRRKVVKGKYWWAMGGYD